MKRILCLLLFTIVLCGCDSTPYKEKKVYEISDGYVKRVEYNEHYYLVFGRGDFSSYVHDPDCHCLKEKEN